MDTNPEFHDVNGDMRLYVARTPAQFNELLGYDPITNSFNASLSVQREKQTQGQTRPHDGEEALFPFALPGKSIAIGSFIYDGQGTWKTYKIDYARLRESSDSLTGIYLVPAHRGVTNIIARGSDAPATPGPETTKLAVSYADTSRDVSGKTFPPGIEPINYWNAGTASELVDVTHRIKDAHNNTRFFGIGNSPSYIIYAIEQLAQRDGAKVHAEYVPFSNRFIEQIPADRDDAATYTFKYDSLQLMSGKNRDKYRDFLSDLGLHPEEIIARYQKTGERTAIIDNIQAKSNFQGGGSFVSFIFFMHDWAKELHIQPAFSAALDCVAVTQIPIPPAIALPEAGLHVPVESFTISSSLREALNSNKSCDTDRFVPAYTPYEWGGPPKPVPAENLHAVERVKALIRQAIDEPEPVARSRFQQAKPSLSGENTYSSATLA